MKILTPFVVLTSTLAGGIGMWKGDVDAVQWLQLAALWVIVGELESKRAKP